jgi:hypothetical protein
MFPSLMALRNKLVALYLFEVFFPKTLSPVILDASTLGNIIISNQKPFGAVVVSNTTDRFINSIQSASNQYVSLYWFKIQGNAQVNVAWFGVAV